MSNIKLYDTVKDNQTGKRFRVTEVISEGGSLVATLKMLDENGKVKKGRGRKMGVEALENGYTRIDLPEVTVRKIDDLSEEERKMVKAFGKKDKDAQNGKQSLTGLSEEEVKEALTASTFGGSKKPENKIIEIPDGTPHEIVEVLVMHRERIEELLSENAKLHETVKELRTINEEWAGGKKEDLEVLKAECISLKEENRQLKDSNVQTNNQLHVRDQEVADLKKTISKMKQEHEAEVHELNDALMEAKAEANAVRKSKEEALSKYNGAVDMLDSDSVAFEAILDLAHIAQSVSQSLYKVSKRIEVETEGRI